MSGRMLVEYGSDLCSNEHHLMGSSENEAWKKFMSSGDLSPRFLRYRCRALPTELTSQLGAGHCTDSKLTSEVMSNWLLIYESHTQCMWIADKEMNMEVIFTVINFFQALFSLLLRYRVHYCKDHFHIHFFIRMSHNYRYVIFTYLLSEYLFLDHFWKWLGMVSWWLIAELSNQCKVFLIFRYVKDTSIKDIQVWD